MKNILCTVLMISTALFIWGCSTGCASLPVEEPLSPYEIVTDSFVRIDIYIGDIPIATGSGSVVAKSGGMAVVLTASHICVSTQPNLTFSATPTLRTNGHVAIVHSHDPDLDLCLLIVLTGLEGVPALALAAGGPAKYENYYNAANPLGSATPSTGYAPVAEGIYMGHTVHPNGESDVYGIPSTSGSSGSPIINEQGALVGVVSRAVLAYPVMSLSPRHSDFHEFVIEGLAKLGL